MKQIIHNNKYDISILSRVHNNKIKQEQDNRQKRWAKFTYAGSETRHITKLFRNTNIKVTYTTNNNLGKLLDTHKTQKQNKYDMNGVYQLKCPTCHKKYISQTGRLFHVRFHEHYNDYKYAKNRPKFAQHIIDERHAFGPINDIMDTIHIAKKEGCFIPSKDSTFTRKHRVGIKLTINLQRRQIRSLRHYFNISPTEGHTFVLNKNMLKHKHNSHLHEQHVKGVVQPHSNQ